MAMAAAMAVAARMMKEDEMVVEILVMAVTVVATVVATVAEALAEQAMAAGTQEACGGARREARGGEEARGWALLSRWGRYMSRWGAQLLVVSPKSACQKSNKKSAESHEGGLGIYSLARISLLIRISFFGKNPTRRRRMLDLMGARFRDYSTGLTRTSLRTCRQMKMKIAELEDDQDRVTLRERPEVRTPKELGAGREEGLRGVTGLVEVGLSSPTRLTSLFANPFSADPAWSAKF